MSGLQWVIMPQLGDIGMFESDADIWEYTTKE